VYQEHSSNILEILEMIETQKIISAKNQNGRIGSKD
jgi:hypothetical protein